jgi:hypothetical protein
MLVTLLLALAAAVSCGPCRPTIVDFSLPADLTDSDLDAEVAELSQLCNTHVCPMVDDAGGTAEATADGGFECLCTGRCE